MVAAPSASTATTGLVGTVSPSSCTATAGTQVGAAAAGSAVITPATIVTDRGSAQRRTRLGTAEPSQSASAPVGEPPD